MQRYQHLSIVVLHTASPIYSSTGLNNGDPETSMLRTSLSHFNHTFGAGMKKALRRRLFDDGALGIILYALSYLFG